MPDAGALARDAILATPLSALDLPTRMENFILREGLETLGDLTRRAPRDVLREKNLGRRTVEATRRLVERQTGISWLDPSPVPNRDAGGGSATDATVSVTHWDVVRASLTDGQRAKRIAQMVLPDRVRAHAMRGGFVTLGDLSGWSDAPRSKSTCHSTVTELSLAVAAHVARVKRDERLAEAGLLESWRTLLENLEPTRRAVLAQRSGSASGAKTLREIGRMRGLSSVRIGQLEAKAWREVRRGGWVDAVRARLNAVLSAGAVALDDLAADAWWSSAVESRGFLAYVVEKVLGAEAFAIRYHDKDWISRHELAAVNSAWAQLRRHAEKIRLPAPWAVFEALTQPLAATIGPRFARELVERLHDLVQLKDSGDHRVVALGQGRHTTLMALLRRAQTPVHLDVAQAQLGRSYSDLPEEVIRFGRGIVGLRHHIPNFDRWRERLVPRAVEIIQAGTPGRQWSCTELLDQLREELTLPEWLTPFVLAALVKSGKQLTYLGRLRVALPGGGGDKGRTHVRALALQLLRDAGGPVRRDALVASIRERIGATDSAIEDALRRAQIVRADRDHVGLAERA